MVFVVSIFVSYSATLLARLIFGQRPNVLFVATLIIIKQNLVQSHTFLNTHKTIHVLCESIYITQN